MLDEEPSGFTYFETASFIWHPFVLLLEGGRSVSLYALYAPCGFRDVPYFLSVIPFPSEEMKCGKWSMVLSSLCLYFECFSLCFL